MYNLQNVNFTNELRVTLVSCDISGLRDVDQAFSNMSFSSLGRSAQSYDVTVSADNDIPGKYIAMRSSGKGAITVFDVDYFTVK